MANFTFEEAAEPKSFSFEEALEAPRAPSQESLGIARDGMEMATQQWASGFREPYGGPPGGGAGLERLNQVVLGPEIPRVESTSNDWLPSAGAATLNLLGGVANFVRTPLGGLAAGAAAIPGALPVLSGLFSADMAKAGGEQLGTAYVTGDKQMAIEGAGSLGMAALPAAHVGAAAMNRFAPERALAKALDAAPALMDRPGLALADRAAFENLRLPDRPPTALPAPTAAETARLIDQAIKERQTGLVVPGELPALEKLKRQFEDQIIPGEETRSVARRPEGEQGGQISFAAEAEAGAIPSARQAAIESPRSPAVASPKAEAAPLTGRARMEAKLAESEKAPVEAPSKSPVEELQSVAALPEKDFITFSREPGGYNRLSKSAGLGMKSVADLDAALTLAESLPAGMDSIYKRSMIREAIEVATDSHSWQEKNMGGGKSPLGSRPLDFKTDPAAAKWLSENEARLAKAGLKATPEHVAEWKAAAEPKPTPPSTPMETKAKAESKQPWEMTGLEFSKQYFKDNPSEIDKVMRGVGVNPDTLHRAAIRKAAKEGKAIPEFNRRFTNSVSEKTPASPSDLTARLEALKFKDVGGGVGANPFPEIGKAVWNTGIDVAIVSIKAGRKVGEAVDDAISHLKKNAKGFDEAKVRSYLSDLLTKEEASGVKPAEVTSTVEAVTERPAATSFVTEKAAKQMEAKVELPVQKDVAKLQEQMETFNREIGESLNSGGQFLPKDMRPDVAKGAAAEVGTATSRNINQHFVNKLVTIRKEFNRVRTELARQADAESQTYFKILQDRFEQAFRQVQELRRASHESLYFWNEIKAEYQQIAQAAGKMPEIKRQLPVIDQIVKDFRAGNNAQAGKHFVDYLRMNLFTLGSWTLDFGTNLAVAATRAPAWAVMDAAHLVTGKPAYRMATALRAAQLGAKNWIPFGERFRLAESVERGLGTTAGGEFEGRGREVMVDFSEILKNRPELANKLRHADLVLGGPVRLKRAVDNFFGRLGATAELYNRAYTEGRDKGLRGDALKSFVEEFVSNPPERAAKDAVRVGKEFKFNRDLTDVEERIAASLGVKLFAESFPRWTFQFVHWGGEMIGADPAMVKKMATGKAKAEEVVTYLSKAATGWGAIYTFNQLVYDNIDANTMEYVNENGDRTRLSGRTPAPELFFVSALMRGDFEKAKAALSQLSLPGAKLISGEPAGVLSPLIDTVRESIRGRYTMERTVAELEKTVNDALPGKSVLGFIRSLFDPTLREGIGANVPGVAPLLPPRINPTTGEPSAPRQRIPGTKITMPTVGGTPFPGAVRVLNDIEKTLMNHGLGVTRPRRTSIVELPAEDVPKELRREYEKRSGQNVREIVGEGITQPEFKEADFETRREVLKVWLAQARKLARFEIADKYNKSPKLEKSEQLNIQRMPERLTK